MHSFHYHEGKLYSEEVDLSRVAQEFGTPLYIYSAGTILDHYRRLDAALAHLDHLICYAVKANSNRAILKLLNDAGAGFEHIRGVADGIDRGARAVDERGGCPTSRASGFVDAPDGDGDGQADLGR